MAGKAPGQPPPGRLLAALGHAVIATDLDGVVTYWSPAAERLYGWTSAEAVGRNIAALTVPEQTQELGAEIMQALRDGVPWSGGFTVRRRDGSTFPALVTDTGIYDDSGALVGIVGVSLDVGHALRPLLDNVADAMVVLTDDARVAYVSPVAGRVFGWIDRTLLGSPLWDRIEPTDRPAVEEQYARVVAGESSVPLTECRVRRADGSLCWVDLRLSNFLADPAVRGVVCNMRDVTERRHDRERLVQLTEQLQTALASRVAIEQAKGMLAARLGCGVDEAFGVLRRYARGHNRKLHDVAREVVAGTLTLTG